jgi:hypothetical protein
MGTVHSKAVRSCHFLFSDPKGWQDVSVEKRMKDCVSTAAVNDSLIDWLVDVVSYGVVD